MSDLSAVAYKSRAPPHCTDVDLYYLLVQARSRNVAMDLTVLLLYDRGFFFQWLEGAEDQLCKVWTSIRADLRHSDIDVRFDDRRPIRLFKGWHMQFGHRDQRQQRTVRDSITVEAHQLDRLHERPRELPALFASFAASGRMRS